MQALEVRRVQSSADLLVPGDYVFIPKREPKKIVIKTPHVPPEGFFRRLFWDWFGKKYALREVLEALWPAFDTIILICPECKNAFATTERHKIFSVEPLTLSMPLTCPYCKTMSFDIKEGKITPIIYHAT